MFGLGKKDAAASGAANLHDEKLKFEVIVNNIDDGVLLIDEQGVVQFCNPAASKITGWPVDEAISIDVKRVMILLDEKGKELSSGDNPFTRVYSSNATVHDHKAVLLSRDRKQLAIDLAITPLLSTEGKINAFIAVFRDVTIARAEEQQRADFISTASHEMRTPVAAIEGYLALALNDKVATVDGRARDYLEKAHASTQNLGKLFQDLLNSAKAEDGRLTSHPQVIELGEFLEQLTNDLRLVAEKKGLFIEYLLGNSSVIDATEGSQGGERVVRPFYYVYADPDRLREVIINLFDNAVKYTPEGKISLGLAGDNEVVQCYVRDTGPGIPSEDLPHLFQKFYRVDNSATRTVGGTGLGLFICRKIVELYGGRIWAESELGKGSTFYINLPRLSIQKANELQKTTQASAELKPIASLATP